MKGKRGFSLAGIEIGNLVLWIIFFIIAASGVYLLVQNLAG